MKNLMSLSFILTAVAAVASEADLARLDHLDRWQWTKDHEVCEAVLQTNQVEVLSSGARAKYDRQLKAAVAGYDAWESERQKHLSSLTDEERKAYKAKCEKSEAERKSNNIHRFEFDQQRAKEVAQKLALARRQLAKISERPPEPEETAMSELLKLKVKWIEDVSEWVNRHLHGISREIDAYKKLDANATQDEREVSKFKIRLKLWDMERDLNKVEMIRSTMSKPDLLVYEQLQKEKDELAKMKNPLRFDWEKKSTESRTKMAEEAKAIIGRGSTEKHALVGPLMTEVVANGSDLKKGLTYYIDDPLCVESRVTNGLYLCRFGGNASSITFRCRRVAVASGRDYVDYDDVSGPLFVYDGVMNFQDEPGTRSVRLFRELSQEEQAGLVEAYRKMKQKKDEEAEARLAALREKAKKAFSGINFDPRGRIRVDKHFRDFVGLNVDKNTEKIVKAIADGDVETLLKLREDRYSREVEEKQIHCVSENQIRITEDWLKGQTRSVELEWLGEEGSMPTYAIFRVSDELVSKADKHEWDGFRSSVRMDSEEVNVYVFCKGRRIPDRKFEEGKQSRNRRIENCKGNIASTERDRIRCNEWIGRLEKELLQIETTARQEVARLQMRLVDNERDMESPNAEIDRRKERQAEDVKRKKQQIAAAIKERDEKTREIEEQEKIVAQIEKEAAEAEAKRIEAERVPGTYTASWTNGYHKAQMAVASSDERIRGFRIEHNQKKITSEQLQEKVRNERRALNEVLLKIVEE